MIEAHSHTRTKPFLIATLLALAISVALHLLSLANVILPTWINIALLAAVFVMQLAVILFLQSDAIWRRQQRNPFSFLTGRSFFWGAPLWMKILYFVITLYLWFQMTQVSRTDDGMMSQRMMSATGIFFFYAHSLILYAKQQRDLHPEVYQLEAPSEGQVIGENVYRKLMWVLFGFAVLAIIVSALWRAS